MFPLCSLEPYQSLVAESELELASESLVQTAMKRGGCEDLIDLDMLCEKHVKYFYETGLLGKRESVSICMSYINLERTGEC